MALRRNPGPGRRRRILGFENLESRRVLSTFQVLAAGTGNGEQLELQIDGTTVQTWNSIGGDAFTGQYVTLTYDDPRTISADRVRLAFTNDLFDPAAGIDRTVRVDGMIIDGVRYETEAPNTYSTGTWTPEAGIVPSFPQSEFLHSNGYFQYFFDSSRTSILQVQAAGAEGDETFDLRIDGAVVASFTTTDFFQLFEYQTTQPIDPAKVEVVFTNDLYVPPDVDRNLLVDFININGFTFQTEDPSVFSTGTWSGGGVTPGFWESETLHVNGEFRYSDTRPIERSQIRFTARGETGQENMELHIDGVAVESWEMIGTSDAVYTHLAAERVTPDRIRVVFTNDLYDPVAGIDRNLIVDQLVLDEVVYETEGPGVYSTGTFSNGGIHPGFRLSETLHADGYFQYAADPGVIRLQSSVIRVPEPADSVDVTILRTGGTDGIVTVDYATVPLTADAGDDFVSQAATVTFFEGESSKVITIPIVDDNQAEADQQFGFTIDNVTGGGSLLAPRTATVTIDDNDSIEATGTGLQGEYFDQRGFVDRLATRVDPTIDFDWGVGAPIVGMGVDDFSVRWTGQIEPRFDETYTFTTSSDDGIRLWIDDQLIIDQWNDHTVTNHSGTMELFAGVRYDIRLEHYDHLGEAVATLSWSAASQPLEVIPQSQLYAADAPPDLPGDNLTAESVASGLIQPVAIDFSPDGSNLYIAEQRGVVRVFRDGSLLPSPLLDFTDRVNGTFDRGLLDIAIHPDFGNNPYIYLLYTYDPPEVYNNTPGTFAGPDGNGNRAGRLTRVTADAATGYTTIVPDSEVILLGSNSVWANFNAFTNSTGDFDEPPAGILPDGSNLRDFIATDSESHTVGSVEFGTDGSLFVSIGDGTSFNRADPRTYRVQDIDNLSGKILRIDPITGNGLPDNPFFNGDAGANRSKVYQYGFRNPFRIAVHPDTGQLYVGDVGWTQWEEINTGAPGANFGWPHFEGGNGTNLRTGEYEDLPESVAFYPTNPTIEPSLLGLSHAIDGINAIVLGAVYNGDTYPAEFQGDLFFADLGRGIVQNVSLDSAGNVERVDTFATGHEIVVQIVQGPDGNLYYVDLDDGEVGRWVFSEEAQAMMVAAGSDPVAPVAARDLAVGAAEDVLAAGFVSDTESAGPQLADAWWRTPYDGLGAGDGGRHGDSDERYDYDLGSGRYLPDLDGPVTVPAGRDGAPLPDFYRSGRAAGERLPRLSRISVIDEALAQFDEELGSLPG